MAGGMHGRRVCMARGASMVGGMHGGGMHDRERGCVWQGGMRGRTDGHSSGRYATYWNVFLLTLQSSCFEETDLLTITIYINTSISFKVDHIDVFTLIGL